MISDRISFSILLAIRGPLKANKIGVSPQTKHAITAKLFASLSIL
jgi:hypothetical protein